MQYELRQAVGVEKTLEAAQTRCVNWVGQVSGNLGVGGGSEQC